ncbi:MAG: tol-pal system YbgF family protein [Maioricimonas sp. JB049]
MLGVCLFAFGMETASAADRVTVQSEGTSSAITLVGDVIDFNRRELKLQQKTGAGLRYIPADDILSVETYYREAHRRAVGEFAAGEIGLAESSFLAAYADEHRPWVQRELLAFLVRCARRQGQFAVAAARFLQIIKSEPATRHWSAVPLIWSPEPVSADTRDKASLWLSHSTEAGRLIGASVLLQDSQHGAVAVREMKQLARVTDQVISALAEAQLWRLKLAPGQTTPNELKSWRDKIARMPADLRGGPYWVLAKAHELAGDYEQAAADWLWLPTVYHEDAVTTVHASLAAARALTRLGRRDEAQTLYREVASRFSWSPLAGEARAAIRDRQQTTDASNPAGG